MSWFEKLKEFIKVNFGIDIKINNSNLINIQINSNNSSKPFEYDEENNSVCINAEKLSSTELEKFGKIARELCEDIPLLEIPSQEIIMDIESKEEAKDVQLLLTYFKDKIPPKDFIVLRQAVYIKKIFEEGQSPDIVYRLKGEVIKKYGRRGLNICNLYSSGYFDTKIKPMYEEITKQGLDKNIFLENYNVIIDEEAFAVFISGNMSFHDVKVAIEKKIKRNLKYGIKTVTIHGIGKDNVMNIRHAISDIEETNSNIKKTIEERGNIILARLWFAVTKNK